MPLVLTSRPEQYTGAVAGTRGVHRAAVIQLTDLAIDDVADYLRRAAPQLVWEPVLARLRSDPASPAVANFAQALTTPLMVALSAPSTATTWTVTPRHCWSSAAPGPIVSRNWLCFTSWRGISGYPRPRRFP